MGERGVKKKKITLENDPEWECHTYLATWSIMELISLEPTQSMIKVALTRRSKGT